MKEIKLIALPCAICGRPVEVTKAKAVEYLGPGFTDWKGTVTEYLATRRPDVSLPKCLEHSPEYWEGP